MCNYSVLISKGFFTPQLTAKPSGLSFSKDVQVSLPTCFVSDEPRTIEVKVQYC